MTATYLDSKDTAKAIRAELKATFPACKFSVVTERGSMVSSVRISWTDGPTTKRVEAVVGKYEAGHFDGMDDSYHYDEDRTVTVDGEVFTAGCQYVFTSRTISPDLANKCIAQVAAYWGRVENIPTAVPGYFGHSLNGRENDKVREDLDHVRDTWSCSIRRAAEDATEFAHT
jgi:hypothetical protein